MMLLCEKGAEDRYRHGQRNQQHIAFQEIAFEARRIVLEPGQGGECNRADGSVERLSRNVDELIGPAVEAQGIGAPEAAQQEFVKVVGEVNNQPVQRDGASKAKHRGNLDISLRPARHPAGGSPAEDRSQARRGNGHCHERPVAEALEGHGDADNVGDQLRADLDDRNGDVPQLTLQQRHVLHACARHQKSARQGDGDPEQPLLVVER